VGHEVDVTIADLVADVRAATPSQAAELVVPDLDALAHRLDAARRRLSRALERRALDERARLDSLRARLVEGGRVLVAEPRTRLSKLREALQHQHPRVRVARDRRRLESLEHQLVGLGRRLPKQARVRLLELDRALRARAAALPRRARAQLDRVWTRLRSRGPALARGARLRLASAAGKLDALSPLAVLERGYAVVSGPEDKALTDARTVERGDQVRVRLHRGRLRATVDSVEPGDPEACEDP
jgi:exodeoxyribonuclease VII large subunit